MPNSRHTSVMASPYSRRATMRRRSSINKLAFHGINTSRQKAKSVTHVSGTKCHLCLGSLIVVGVATYAYELFSAYTDLDTVYVPIGLGSGICGLIGVRDALGLTTRIVGVVSERANAYRLSLEAGRVVPTNSALTFADGVAVRAPDAAALEIIRRGAERIVEVSDAEIAEAIRILFSDTHTLAEGAGAAALAALMRERGHPAGRRVGVIVTGHNIDRSWMQAVLAGGTPRVE